MDSRTWPAGKNVKKATWDPETEILTVYFMGGTYQYSGVDKDTWETVKASDSGGRAIHEHVIGNFDTERIN